MSIVRSRQLRGAAYLCAFVLGTAVSVRADEVARDLEASGHDLLADVAQSDDPTPLELDAVLASVDRHFPLLIAAELERQVRQAALQSSRGEFDTRVRIDGDLRPVGFYQNYGGAAMVEQPTRLWGARFKGGYRYGGGDFPSYDGNRLTDESGELLAGIRLPLLRGGSIDAERARLQRREIDWQRVDPEIELQRIEIHRVATRAYWDWVSAGFEVEVAKQLLDFAESRQSQIAGRVARGAEPRIDLVDNERLIVDRRVLLRGLERDFEQASIALSLYQRSAAGDPQRSTPGRLPPAFPPEIPLERERVVSDIEYARTQHPIVRQLGLDRARLDVDAKLARNDVLPSLDLDVTASQDFGHSTPGIDTSGKLSLSPRSDTQVKALIRIEMPVQRRKAKGRLAVANARAAQIDQRTRFERERIVADIQQAVAGLDAAFDQTAEARTNLKLAEQMRVAEERKLSLGLSNLINVNIREVQAASAAQSLIAAQEAYFQAVADYEATVARQPAETAPPRSGGLL